MASNDSDSSKSRGAGTGTLLLQNSNEVKKVFERFDTNGDGMISASELSSVMEALGSESSPPELEKMMEEMDTNHDGFVSLEEFAEFCAKRVEGDESGSQELKDAFDMYDQDKNGLISSNELHLVLTKLGERCTVGDCAKMIQTFDSDGDGNVNFDEFKKMMTNSSGKKA